MPLMNTKRFARFVLLLSHSSSHSAAGPHRRPRDRLVHTRAVVTSPEHEAQHLRPLAALLLRHQAHRPERATSKTPPRAPWRSCRRTRSADSSVAARTTPARSSTPRHSPRLTLMLANVADVRSVADGSLHRSTRPQRSASSPLSRFFAALRDGHSQELVRPVPLVPFVSY